jgi:hypothetical protein
MEQPHLTDIEPLQSLAVERAEAPQEISMISLKILTAATIVSISVPAFAAFAFDGPSRSVDANPLGFIVQTQPDYLNEGFDSNRTVRPDRKAPAAHSRRSAPVGVDAARRR